MNIELLNSTIRFSTFGIEKKGKAIFEILSKQLVTLNLPKALWQSWQVKHFLWNTLLLEAILSASKTLPLHLKS